MRRITEKDIDKMSNASIKSIYSELWCNKDLCGDVCRVWYKGKPSDNSYMFISDKIGKSINKDDEKNILELLKTVFQIDNDDFNSIFHDACFGQGEEYKEILRLHSSALCPLLFFSDLKRNPMELILEGKRVLFNKAVFEYKNAVMDLGFPSNIDVVLISEDCKTLLFLESKFSEYINTSCDPIKVSYLETKFYKDDFLTNMGLRIIKENGMPKRFADKKGEGFKLETINTKESCYLDGIKQMISHYIGIENFISMPAIDKRLEYVGQKIYLGEIIFDFNFDEAKTKLENYTRVYQKLAKSLNSEDNDIRVLTEPLKYSMFKSNDYKINSRIKNFYFGDKHE